MPRPARPSAYGPEYELLLLEASNSGTFYLPLPSEAHARTFRMRFYGYLASLRKAAIRHDLLEKSDKLSVALDGAGLLFYPREDGWDAEAIRAGLGVSKSQVPPVAPTAHSMLVQKLAEIRARTEKKPAKPLADLGNPD